MEGWFAVDDLWIAASLVARPITVISLVEIIKMKTDIFEGVVGRPQKPCLSA
jgi:hypothetical protein